ITNILSDNQHNWRIKKLNFKQALFDFFILHWATEEMVPFIGNKTIHINFKQCYFFVVNDSKSIVSRIVEDDQTN
ncbi:hypothetical protein L9F63_001867, partial [Diploptera punctata]